MSDDRTKAFRTLRKKLKLNQVELAAAFGLNVQAVRDIESGRTPVVMLHFYALAGLQYEAALSNPHVITAKMLTTSQYILERSGYQIVRK